jgi:hypothetical protein
MKLYISKAIKALLLFLSLVVGLSTLAQKPKVSKKDTSGIIKIEIKQSTGSPFDDGRKGKGNYQNILKLDFFRAAFEGEVPITYERMLGKNLSMEIGLGLTYHNLIFDVLQSGDNHYDEENYLSSSTYATSQLGYSFRAEIHFFFDADDAPEGFYLGPGLVLKTYNLSYQGNYNDVYSYNYSGTTIPVSFNTTNSYNNFLMYFGYQSFPGDGQFYYGIDLGLGIGARTIEKIEIVRDYDRTFRGFNPITINSTNFVYSYGIKVGVAF